MTLIERLESLASCVDFEQEMNEILIGLPNDINLAFQHNDNDAIKNLLTNKNRFACKNTVFAY